MTPRNDRPEYSDKAAETLQRDWNCFSRAFTAAKAKEFESQGYTVIDGLFGDSWVRMLPKQTSASSFPFCVVAIPIPPFSSTATSTQNYTHARPLREPILCRTWFSQLWVQTLVVMTSSHYRQRRLHSDPKSSGLQSIKCYDLTRLSLQTQKQQQLVAAAAAVQHLRQLHGSFGTQNLTSMSSICIML